MSLAAQSGIRVQRRLPDRLPPHDPDLDLVIYRVAQEALTNAIRHARATSVQVRLRRTPTSVSLEVRDDGVGLGTVVEPRSGEHLGMFGMRERARLLGGQFQASAIAPRGTLVQVSIPLTQ